MLVLVVLISCVFSVQLLASPSDWLISCGECKCAQNNDHIVANCSVKVNNSAVINRVPTVVPITIHTLDLSEQVIHQIDVAAFSSAGLRQLHILTMYKCQIRLVDTYALRSLLELEDLDLSWNEIAALDSNTFETNSLLKRIRLNNNRLEVLPDALFANLTNLHELFLYGNRLTTIGTNTFYNNPNLSYINLEDNKLTHFDYSIIETLPELSYLILPNNRWTCDCHSEKLLNTLTARNLTRDEFVCQTSDATDRILKEVLAENRTCAAYIVSISASKTGYRTMLTCKVSAGVAPMIRWEIFRRDENVSISSSDQFTVTNATNGYDYWFDLVIEEDTGDSRYKCVAIDANGEVMERIIIIPMKIQQARLSNWIFYFVGAVAIVFIVVLSVFLVVRSCTNTLHDNESIEADVSINTPSSSIDYHDTSEALHKMMYKANSQELA